MIFRGGTRIGILAFTVFGIVSLQGLPTMGNQDEPRGSLSKALEDLGAKDVQQRDSARRSLLQAGPGSVGTLQEIRGALAEILSMHADLKSPNGDKAVTAVQYFTKYKAADYVAVALSSANAGALLAAIDGLSVLKAKSVLPEVLNALEKNNFIQEGSEQSTVHQKVVAGLITLLRDLSGREYRAQPDETDKIRSIVEDARKRFVKK